MHVISQVCPFFIGQHLRVWESLGLEIPKGKGPVWLKCPTQSAAVVQLKSFPSYGLFNTASLETWIANCDCSKNCQEWIVILSYKSIHSAENPLVALNHREFLPQFHTKTRVHPNFNREPAFQRFISHRFIDDLDWWLLLGRSSIDNLSHS